MHERRTGTRTAPTSRQPTDRHRDAVVDPRGPLSPGSMASLQRLAGNRAATQLAQRNEQDAEGAAATGEQVRSLLRDGGSPLPPAFRTRAESFLGADFTGVRLHNGAAAAESARAMQSQAYTSGTHIVFGPGMYDSSSAAGQNRLVHELTHVVQQQRGPVDGAISAGGLKISDPCDRFEREADKFAAAFTAGASPVTPTTPNTFENGGIQRQVRHEEGELQRKAGTRPAIRMAVQRKNLNQALPTINKHCMREETHREYVEEQLIDPKDPSKTITVTKAVGPELITRRSIVQSSGSLPQEARVYSETASLQTAGRLQALQTAAVHNAKAGKDADAYGKSVSRERNYKWTRRSSEFDNDAISTLDPFFYEITVPFLAPDSTRQVLDLIYQHAAAYTGYVESIYDSTNDDTRDLASMRDESENAATAKSDRNIRNPKYTNVHNFDKTGKKEEAKIIDLTSGKEEKNLDAYTKIAGEGARWQCVRNHSGTLRDRSLFFVHDPADTHNVYGLNFRELWLSWASVFNKEYDIADDQVVDALKKNRLSGRYVAKRFLKDNWDYDLESSTAYKKPSPPQSGNHNNRGRPGRR